MEADQTIESETPKETTIKEILEKYPDVTFVHGIHATHWTNNNSLLSEHASWKDKLDIALNFAPNLSASTIRQGENTNVIWSRMGLLIADGNIEAMYSVDAGSKARGLNNREIDSRKKQSSVIDTFNRSGSKNGHSGGLYNEVIVSHPKYVGFYLAIDKNIGDESVVSDQEIVVETETRGLPLYLMLEGRLFSLPREKKLKVIEILRKEVQSGRYRDDKSLSEIGVEPVVLSDLETVVSDSETRDREKNRLLKSSHFDVDKLAEKNEELTNIIAYRWGIKGYMDFAIYKHNRRIGEDEKYPRSRKEVEASGRKIIEVTLRSFKGTYFEYETNKGKKRVVTLTKNLNTGSESCQFEIVSGMRFVMLGAGGGVNFDYDVHNSEDYVSELIFAVNKLVNRWGDIDNLSQQCRYHLYGFALAARNFGDEVAVGKIEAILGEDLEKIKEVVGRRVDQDGNINIFETDLSTL